MPQDENAVDSVEEDLPADNSEQTFDDAFAEFNGDKPEEVSESESDDSEEPEETAEEEQETEQASEYDESADDVENNTVDDQDDWKHKYHSNQGRLSAATRENEELKRKLKELQESPQKPEIKNEKFQQMQQDYPDIAAAMLEMMGNLEGTNQNRYEELSQKLNPLQSTVTDIEVNSQLTQLAKAHPDYQKVSQSQEFGEWMGQQHPSVQQLGGSMNAYDNIYLLDLYKKGLQPESASADTQTLELQNKRQKQLQSAQTLNSKTRSKGNNNPGADDFDAAWEHYTKDEK